MISAAARVGQRLTSCPLTRADPSFSTGGEEDEGSIWATKVRISANRRRRKPRRSSRRCTRASRTSPDSVEPAWRGLFEGLESGPRRRRAGRNPAWPLDSTDDLTAALDPTQMEPAAKPAKVAPSPHPPPPPRPSQDEIVRAASDSIRAMMLIRTYRVRGHLAANLDPLGPVASARCPPISRPNITAFPTATSTARSISAARSGSQWATVRELVDILRANYCGNVGLEYMHIADVEERRFLQERMEGKDKAIDFTPRRQEGDPQQGDRSRAVGDASCGKKYVGTKRFGLDGGEAMIPALECGDQIWRRSWASTRSSSAWRIAAA